MVSTRSRTKKIHTYFSQASTDDPDHQSTQSGALIGSNDDLLSEILLRVPLTSILRFKSVSKHWRLLLSHRHFTQRYDKLSKSPGLFALNTYVPFDVENPSPPHFPSLGFDRHGIRILQSCNGLLLCCTDQENRGGRKFYVVNPTTSQFATIPSIPRGWKVGKTICFMGLAFHQTDCVHYKVVCIRSLDPVKELFQIQIYSSDTRKWKVSVESFYVPKTTFEKGVYWNGAVYWAPSYSSHFYFNLDAQELQTLPLPVEMMSSEKFATMYFGESRGHLHLIVCNPQHISLHLNVYEMLSDHSGWFVKYQIQLDVLVDAFPDVISQFTYRYHFIVIDVVRGEEEEDAFLVLKTPKMIITYGVHDKSFKPIFRYSFVEDVASYQRYTETLSSF